MGLPEVEAIRQSKKKMPISGWHRVHVFFVALYNSIKIHKHPKFDQGEIVELMLNVNLFIIADQCHFIIWITLYLILLDLAFGGIKKAAPFPWIRANIVHDPMYSPIAGTRYVKRTCPKIMYISKVYITSQLQEKPFAATGKQRIKKGVDSTRNKHVVHFLCWHNSTHRKKH